MRAFKVDVHTRSSFRVHEEERLLVALRRYGFTTLITADRGGRVHASRLATILRRDRAERIRLLTHMDRRNPQLATLEPSRELLLVAHGPDAYISPAWYLRRPSVPSWNYIAIHVRGFPRLFPDERPELTEWLLRETVTEYESRRNQPWFYDVPDEFHCGLARGVAAFEIAITSLDGAFKLSQDKSEADRRSVIASLAASDGSLTREIAALMQLELPGEAGAFNDPIEIPALSLDLPTPMEGE